MSSFEARLMIPLLEFKWELAYNFHKFSVTNTYSLASREVIIDTDVLMKIHCSAN
jgi:hypothetical protein